MTLLLFAAKVMKTQGRDKMNLLGKETSPYLLQHKNNPVHWLPWGEEAFARARREKKPVLLSIGYSSCHWCHVMARESFSDTETAELMNAHFISIKVDREERPDVDALYQHALLLMGLQGGWPLTLFLNADKIPFWGGTYFPPFARHGLMAFKDVLTGIHQSHTDEPDKIAYNAKVLKEALEKTAPLGKKALLTQSIHVSCGKNILAVADRVHGGLGTAPKFPNLPALSYLWALGLRTGDPEPKSAVLTALQHMCLGGIYDHLGGGFFRYATDPAWLIPHFEKMLGDNGLFLTLLADVCRETHNPLFERALRETADWVLREMATDDGAFAASLDAESPDAAGEKAEGAFYVWSKADVTAALQEDADFFCTSYDVTQGGNWQNANILNRLAKESFQPGEKETRLRALCRRLRAEREKRARPARDCKILADWNGLAIEGLASAGFALGEEKYTQAAEKAFEAVLRLLSWDTGTLRHSCAQARLGAGATLDDYAFLSAAGLALYETTGKQQYLQRALSLAKKALKDFFDVKTGEFFLSGATDLPVRTRSWEDSSTPAGSAVLADVLTRLSFRAGQPDFEKVVQGFLFETAARAQAFPLPAAALLKAGLFWQRPLQLAVPAGVEGEKFRATLRHVSGAGVVLLQKPQKAEAVFCLHHTCFDTVKDPALLPLALRKHRLWPGTANDT